MKDIDALARRLGDLSMLHRVAKISICFQGLPKIGGSSTQHERNMETIWRTYDSTRKAKVICGMTRPKRVFAEWCTNDLQTVRDV
jgi:hypothetical protein